MSLIPFKKGEIYKNTINCLGVHRFEGDGKGGNGFLTNYLANETVGEKSTNLTLNAFATDLGLNLDGRRSVITVMDCSTGEQKNSIAGSLICLGCRCLSICLRVLMCLSVCMSVVFMSLWFVFQSSTMMDCPVASLYVCLCGCHGLSVS